MAQPPAQAAPWESEQVPYDDAMVGGFAADAGGDDLPPFDVPGAASATKAAAVAPAASANDDVPAAPWESNPGAGSPFWPSGRSPEHPADRGRGQGPSSAASLARPPSSPVE